MPKVEARIYNATYKSFDITRGTAIHLLSPLFMGIMEIMNMSLLEERG